MTQFKEKFVGFIDILGFKDLVEKAEKEDDVSLRKLLEIVAKLGNRNSLDFFKENGPQTCPSSKFIAKDLDFQILQISDCAIISSEMSAAGIINLLIRFWSIVLELMQDGILCRGYITCGKVYHTENQIIGSGYHNAYISESAVTAFRNDADERGTPFVELDPLIDKYIQTETDDCVKEVFGRIVENDGTISAIFPFKCLSHTFAISDDFDPIKEKQSNNKLRERLLIFKAQLTKYVDSGNVTAMQKIEHYLSALDKQLDICDRTDIFIHALCKPFPSVD